MSSARQHPDDSSPFSYVVGRRRNGTEGFFNPKSKLWLAFFQSLVTVEVQVVRVSLGSRDVVFEMEVLLTTVVRREKAMRQMSRFLLNVFD